MYKTITLITLLLIHTSSFASGTKTVKFISDIQNAYIKADYINCQVNILSTRTIKNSITRQTNTDLSITLKKPNLFLIKWSSSSTDDGGVTLEGAVWNNGEKAYLYQKEHGSYFSFNNFERALIFSGQFTNYVSYKIPVLFISQISEENWLIRLPDSGSSEIDETGPTLKNIVDKKNFIRKTELKLSKESFIITETKTETVRNITKNNRITELKLKKENLINNSDKLKTMVNELEADSGDEVLEELITFIDEEIQRQELLSSNKTVEITKTVESYHNFNFTPTQKFDFNFKLPSNTKYFGDTLEKYLLQSNYFSNQ